MCTAPAEGSVSGGLALIGDTMLTQHMILFGHEGAVLSSKTTFPLGSSGQSFIFLARTSVSLGTGQLVYVQGRPGSVGKSGRLGQWEHGGMEILEGG